MVPSQVKKLHASSHCMSSPVPRMPMVAVGVANPTLRLLARAISPVSARAEPRSSDTRKRPSLGFLSSNTKLSILKRVAAPSVSRLSSRNASTPRAATPVSIVSPG